MHGQQNDKYTEMHRQQNDNYTEMHGQQNIKSCFGVWSCNRVSGCLVCNGYERKLLCSCELSEILILEFYDNRGVIIVLKILVKIE
jgi:hypothetical protein